MCPGSTMGWVCLNSDTIGPVAKKESHIWVKLLLSSEREKKGGRGEKEKTMEKSNNRVAISQFSCSVP